MKNLYIFLMQLSGMMLYLSTTHRLINLPLGTAVGFIFLRGFAILPGMLLGNLCALWVSFSFRLASIMSLYEMLYVVLLYMSVQRFIGATLYFPRWSQKIKFMLILGLINSLLTLALQQAMAETSTVLFMFSLANLNGIFIIAMGMILLDAYAPDLVNIYLAKKPAVLISLTLVIALIISADSYFLHYSYFWMILAGMTVSIFLWGQDLLRLIWFGVGLILSMVS